MSLKLMFTHVQRLHAFRLVIFGFWLGLILAVALLALFALKSGYFLIALSAAFPLIVLPILASVWLSAVTRPELCPAKVENPLVEEDIEVLRKRLQEGHDRVDLHLP